MKNKTTNEIATLPIKERRAPRDLVERWATAICADGDDAQAHTSALLLLLDEIDRAQFDPARISDIAWTAQKAAFGESDQADEARVEFVEELRRKNGLRIVQKKRATG